MAPLPAAPEVLPEVLTIILLFQLLHRHVTLCPPPSIFLSSPLCFHPITGFKVSLSSLRSWSCPERKYILSDGAKHGSKFETAVGMLDNFLMKTAQNEMSMDIFEYLSSIHGSLYSLLDRRCEVESESSNYSPDIKKLKMDPSRLRVNVSECGGEVKCDEENDKNDNNNDINTDLEDDNVEINGTTSRGLTSVRRNLQKDLTNDTNDETLTESSPILERMSCILSSLSSDGCRNYLRQIFDDKQKSLLKVLYEHRQRTLKAAKLNHFGPLKRDEDVDEVMSILKQYYLGFSTKESLTINDLEVVMQVYLPEALCFALNDVEGKSFNEAAREIWFGIKASNSAVSSLL